VVGGGALSPESPARFIAFEPGAECYSALACLLTKVWPEQPASAAWLERCDVGRDPTLPFRREVAVRPGAEWVGVAEVGAARWSGDSERFELQVHVLPNHRGLGIGSELCRRAVAWVGGRASSFSAETREDRPAAVRFLERFGFRVVCRVPISELDLGRFDPAPFAAVVRRVEGSGVELRTLAVGPGELERLLPGLYALQGEVQGDVPGEADRSMPRFESWQRAYRDNPDFLPEAHVVAVEREQVVGMTQLWASQATAAILYTGFTGVRRSHRRRGIATALKVRSLAWACRLRTADGRFPVVRTGNEESNPMLAINFRLGFREGPATLRFVTELPERTEPGR
jgi:mycothiol synthase